MTGVMVAEGENVCEPKGYTAGMTHTFKVVFVLTCFTMMSASDLSNYPSKGEAEGDAFVSTRSL